MFAVIFSQDQDLAEVVNEVKEIARDTNRWIKVVSAFPTGPAATAQRGVNGAEWYPMVQAFYDACLDLRDYRPKDFKMNPLPGEMPEWPLTMSDTCLRLTPNLLAASRHAEAQRVSRQS